MLKLLIALFAFSSIFAIEEKSMVIVVPSYKNIQWYEQNLGSLLTQDYKNFRIIYVDDCSPDGTGKAVQKFLAKWKGGPNVTLKINKVRVGAMENIYNAVHECADDDIVVLVDGDDWLPNNHVLKDLNEAYSSEDVWFTHGRLIEYPHGHSNWCEPLKPEAIKNNTYRKFKCPSHLRTFYAWLFKLIKKEDFMYEGKFLAMTWDMAIMFPLAEMASERHKFMDEINYVYNMANSINDNKVNPDLQNYLDYVMRNRPPYSRLEKRPEPLN